jgi:ATP-dependent Clp protease ATP-binding subunit ClpA
MMLSSSSSSRRRRRRRRRRRGTLADGFELAPVVGELFATAQDEAIAFRHDSIGTEHVFLALIGRNDETGRLLRGLGLELASVRADTRRIVGDGPAREGAFDAEALAAIGIDLHAVRERVEETFGEGALERASRRRGSCGAAGFGVAPRLKLALERAREDAARRQTPLSTAHVALSLGQQRDSVVACMLDARSITLERLHEALSASLDRIE